MPMSNQRKKILFLSLSGIGNYVMQSPAIAATRQQWPDAKISVWVAPRGTAVLAEADPNVDEVIEMPIKASVFQHTAAAWRLALRKFDIGIVLSPGQHFKSAAYLWLAGIPVRVGAKYRLGGRQRSGFWLTHSLDEDTDLHDIEQNLRLLSLLGVSTARYAGEPYQIVLPEAALRDADVVVDKMKIPTESKLFGFHMGSSEAMKYKRWPVDNFIELGRQLSSEDRGAVLLFGGRNEMELKSKVKVAFGERAHIVDEDLLCSAAVASKCELFISNDSGLMHIAAAVGTKTLGLFGPTDEKLTGPRGVDSHALRAEGTKPVFDTDLSFELGARAHESLEQLKIESVIDFIEAIV